MVDRGLMSMALAQIARRFHIAMIGTSASGASPITRRSLRRNALVCETATGAILRCARNRRAKQPLCINDTVNERGCVSTSRHCAFVSVI